jgi:hypothetical protein
MRGDPDGHQRMWRSTRETHEEKGMEGGQDRTRGVGMRSGREAGDTDKDNRTSGQARRRRGDTCPMAAPSDCRMDQMLLWSKFCVPL